MEYSGYESFKMIRIEISLGVCYARLCNPAKKNALNEEMLTELIALIETLDDSFGFRALVISGDGGFFCAGADLDWMKKGVSQSKMDNIRDAELFYTLYTRLSEVRIPVISLVEGGALGGALGLLACSDIVIAEQSAKMAFPEVRFGLVPATIAPFVLKKCNQAFVRRMMLTGEKFSVHQAFNAGLVTDVVADGEGENRLTEILDLIKMNPIWGVNQTKQLINRITEGDKTGLMSYCTSVIAEARRNNEKLTKI